MRQQSSSPSGERKTQGSQGCLPLSFVPSQTTTGGDQVKPPSWVMDCSTCSVPSSPMPLLRWKRPSDDPSFSHTMLEKVMMQRKGSSFAMRPPMGGSSRQVLPSSSLTMRGMKP